MFPEFHDEIPTVQGSIQPHSITNPCFPAHFYIFQPFFCIAECSGYYFRDASNSHQKGFQLVNLVMNVNLLMFLMANCHIQSVYGRRSLQNFQFLSTRPKLMQPLLKLDTLQRYTTKFQTSAPTSLKFHLPYNYQFSIHLLRFSHQKSSQIER